jgi:RimJ/RimL family protein N-acetyltransferase
VRAVLRGCKEARPGTHAIPSGHPGLALVPVTWGHAEDDALIATLAAWRAREMAVYPTQFTVTDAGTRAWLRDIVLGGAGRLMFLVVDEDDPAGPPAGHLGLDTLLDGSAAGQVSNVLVGDRGRMPRGAMEAAARSMLAWARDALGIEAEWATPFGTNRRAIRLFERLGFACEGTIPLRRHAEGDRVAFRPVAPGDTAPPDRTWLLYVRR